MTSFRFYVLCTAVRYLPVIIAATVYHDDATDYLSNTDDLNSVHKEFDDKLDAKKLVWLFFLYAALSTIVIIALQWRIDKRLKHQAAKHVAQVSFILQ